MRVWAADRVTVWELRNPRLREMFLEATDMPGYKITSRPRSSFPDPIAHWDPRTQDISCVPVASGLHKEDAARFILRYGRELLEPGWRLLNASAPETE